MTDDRLDTEKYLEVLEYLLRSENEGGANNATLGKVKLMKLLYYADFDHFEKHGTSVTGDSYRKLDYGPVPRNADRMLNELLRQERLNVSKQQQYHFWRYAYTLHLPNEWRPERLSHEEGRTLAEVVERWRNHTTQSIVRASHGEPPWKLVEYGEEIPYYLVHFREAVEPHEDEEPESVDSSPILEEAS